MIMVITFVFAMIIGVPIAFVVGLVGLVGLLQIGPEFLMAVPQRLFASANNYNLMAIPMFILAGELLGLSGDVERLMNFCRALIGRVKGGIAYVSVAVGLMLSGILGMANAIAALLSSTIYPEMIKDNYEPEFSACFIASVSMVGPLIPPGLLFVLYGVASGTSIAELFMAGVIPGLLVALALSIVIFFLSLNPERKWKKTEWEGWRNVWTTMRAALFSIVAPFLTFVTVASGIATPTESASVIVVLVALVGIIVYRKITLWNLIPILVRAAVISGSILIITAMAGVMGWVMALEQIPQRVAGAMISISDNELVVLFIIQIFLLLIGLFLDAAPAVLILVPVFMPIIQQFGYNPVHFGLLMVFNLSIGVLTPPVGTCLFTTSVTTGVPVDKMIRSIWPWIGVLVFVLLLCTYFPQLSLFIPRLITGR